MQFINPKTDFAFKKIFGSKESTDVLKSFLNAIVYNEQPIISSLEILDPYLAPQIRGMKETYVDVRAVLADGTTVIIEMQVLNVEGFEKRILYNAAKAYSSQLPEGENYTLLNPVIALTITDFVMFDTYEQHISRYILKEKELFMDYPMYDVELVFVELPKFTRSLEELQTLADKWLYFLKYAKTLDAVPDSMQSVSELNKAFSTANRVNLSKDDLEDIQRREMFLHDQHNARTKAEKMGLAKGLKQGLQEGMKEGMKEGEKKAARQIASNLLDVLDDATISAKTGLSVQEIQALRKE